MFYVNFYSVSTSPDRLLTIAIYLRPINALYNDHLFIVFLYISIHLIQ